MFQSNYYHSWRKKARKKGLFGGDIKSQSEIKSLQKKIEKHENLEFSEFEKQFDAEIESMG